MASKSSFADHELLSAHHHDKLYRPNQTGLRCLPGKRSQGISKDSQHHQISKHDTSHRRWLLCRNRSRPPPYPLTIPHPRDHNCNTPTRRRPTSRLRPKSPQRVHQHILPRHASNTARWFPPQSRPNNPYPPPRPWNVRLDPRR